MIPPRRYCARHQLSIGDPYQPVLNALSRCEALDWLAWIYQMLFIVSCGTPYP